jgi:hypothetical protein
MRQRKARIRRYLVMNRGLEPRRVRVVDGGFRERVTVELWLVKLGGQFPKPKPTVLAKNVKYRRTKVQFRCSTFY